MTIKTATAVAITLITIIWAVRLKFIEIAIVSMKKKLMAHI